MPFNQLVQNLESPLGQFFTSSPVLTCSSNSKIKDVIDLMNKNLVGSIVITENKKPIGIFTERDVLKKVVGSTIIDIATTPIEHLMTKNPVCVTLSTPFTKIMAAMRLGKFRHLIIVDEQGHLSGIISIKDVLSRVIDVVNDLK